MANAVSPARASVPDPGLVRLELRRPTKRQVLDSARWFVRLRWFASLGVALGGIAASWLGFAVDWLAFVTIAGFLMASNVALFAAGKTLARGDPSGRVLARYSLAQVFVDWVGVLALVHWTGGVNSPALFFFFFHLVMSSILQPARRVYPIAVAIVLGLAFLFWAEATGMLEHHPLLANQGNEIYRNPRWIGAVVGILALSAVSTVFLTTWVAELLRRRMVQLAKTKVRLEQASRKMEAVYDVVNSLGATQELDELLEQVVQEAVDLGEISAAFVALIEPKERRFVLASVHGMEDDEMQPEHLDFLEQERFKKGLERGEAVELDDLLDCEECEGVPCLEWLKAQGKRSLLAVPLGVGDKLTGVLCVVCIYPGRFKEIDARFFEVFADLISVGIEGARTNQLLLEHNRSRTWFFNRVAHDLRSPLSAMRSMLTLITDGYVDDVDKIKELSGRVKKRAEAFNEMVDDLLALANDKMGEIQEELEPVDVQALLKSVCDLFEQEASRKGLLFHTRLDCEESAIVAASARDLERALNNLLSNAVKYTPEDGGEVRVELNVHDMEVMVVVADTGIGIPADGQQNLFQEFFRAPNARKMTQVGTGLGLRITRKLVESFGGTLHFTSVENEGSTFVVSFPRQILRG